MQIKHRDFVQNLWDCFNSIGIVGAPPYTNEYYDKRTGKTDTTYGFATFKLPFFTDLHPQWYTKADGQIVSTFACCRAVALSGPAPGRPTRWVRPQQYS
jgi:hypothetical protein